MAKPPYGELAQRYTRLMADRDQYMREAYESALLTLPSVFPENQDARHSNISAIQLPKPYQSLGARGVNTLASKLLLALFPPTAPFCRYEIDPALFAGLSQEERAQTQTELQVALADRERKINAELDIQGLRTKLIFAIKHLIITGNALIYMPPEGGMRVFPLSHFVVSRDGMGNLLELTYVEILDHRSVSPEVQSILDQEPSRVKGGKSAEKPVHVFTGVCRDGDSYEFWQEVHDRVVPDSTGRVQGDKLPWLALRFVELDGEDYGRGFVEEYRGDLRSAEELAKALVIASLNAAKLVPVIAPNSQIKPGKLVALQNGEPIVGNATDVTFLQQDKHADMSVARAQLESITQSLAADFMLNSSFQRNAERVTAEEVRRMAEELESTLGGIYSALAQELQLPVALRLEGQLQKRKALATLPKGTVRPTIVTGLAAIGRGQDLQRLREGIALVAEFAAIKPDVVQYINSSDAVKRFFLGVGIDTAGLLKTEQQVQAENAAAQQAQQQQALADNVVPELAKAGGQALQPTLEQSFAQQGPEGLANNMGALMGGQ